MAEFTPPGTRWVDLPSSFPMKRGNALYGARMAYETWGTLNAVHDNAILILTGMSPDAHAASNTGNPAPGWWEWMIGPGKPIDTQRWFVVCVNALGSCKGSTGPASINPSTGAPYRLDFPELSIEDGADAALAVVQLRRLADNNARRAALVARYYLEVGEAAPVFRRIVWGFIGLAPLALMVTAWLESR